MRNIVCLLLILITITTTAQNLKSGGKLKPEQAIIDIRHYTLVLDVDPENKTINGYTEIDLNLLQSTGSLLFDLWHGLTIKQVWVNGKTTGFTHSADDLVHILLKQEIVGVPIKILIPSNYAVLLVWVQEYLCLLLVC